MNRVAEVLLLIGGGEHARVVLEAARASGASVAGCWANTAPKYGGLVWHGTDEDLASAIKRWAHEKFHLAIGGRPGSTVRQSVLNTSSAARWASVVHPDATVSPSATLMPGCFIGARAVVNAGAIVGVHAIINSGAIVEHDARIGEGSHVAPGAVLGGGVKVGAWAFIGLGARVRDHVTIGDGAIVGMGAVVLRDVADGATVLGVPAMVRKGWR